VSLKEFSITPSGASVTAGEVAFQVSNAGTVVHELLVLKTDKDPKQLPTKADGTVDEVGAGLAGEVSDLDPGKSGTSTFTLAAGQYALICYVPGHYVAGMATPFKVS
jgi:uncharacterized cupredoxin-like copper-binding protein